jgi:HAD superfamily hydrolase (TIGR01509 family)
LKAIVFDCDGVLVDSEIVASRVVATMIGDRVPGGMSFERFMHRFAGQKTEDSLRELADETGAVFPEDFIQQIETAVDEALVAELEPIPDVARALASIDLPKAVASNSQFYRILQSLDRAGIRGMFEGRICSADHVARPKPAPDVYLLAAERLGVAPADCLAVEDSPTGVTAAKAAGMTVIGFLGGSHVLPGQDMKLLAAGAVELVYGMAALPELVRERLAA